MATTDAIYGKYISLRSVEEKDADFIVQIRSGEKARFLHSITPNIESQKQWIKNQIVSENDYYFLYENKEKKKIGLAAIYNINEKDGSAEFGRWISNGNIYENVETVLLLFDFAFNTFSIDFIYLRMVAGNDYVSSFWRTFGAKHVGLVYEMDLDIDKWIVYREDYLNFIRPKYAKMLKI